MFSLFKLSPQKLRAMTLDQSRLELEQYTLQHENLRANIGMLRQRIARLEKSVAADEEFKAKCAARIRSCPPAPPRPPTWQPSTTSQPQEKSDVKAHHTV